MKKFSVMCAVICAVVFVMVLTLGVVSHATGLVETSKDAYNVAFLSIPGATLFVIGVCNIWQDVKEFEKIDWEITFFFFGTSLITFCIPLAIIL